VASEIIYINSEPKVLGKDINVAKLFKNGDMNDYKKTIDVHFTSLCNDQEIEMGDIEQIVFKYFRADKAKASPKNESAIKNFDIENNSFVAELNKVIESLLLRNNTISELIVHLASKSISLQNLIDQVLGLRNQEFAELTEEQVNFMFSTVKFKISARKLRDFIVAVSATGETSKIKVRELFKLEKAVSGEKDQPTKKNIRRFNSSKGDKAFEHIGHMISQHKMRDIGPLLKGHDFSQKCQETIHAYLKKFKRIHLSFEQLIDELTQISEDPSAREKTATRKHLGHAENINEELKAYLGVDWEKVQYESAYNKVHKMEVFDHYLPSTWEKLPEGKDLSKILTDAALRPVTDFLAKKRAREAEFETQHSFARFQNQIENNSLYQVIWSISEFTAGDGLKEGDVMDLINALDPPPQRGYIDLDAFKLRVDQYIHEEKQ
jgi:hypothetical protein